MVHVEVINPSEKIARELGGTGYLPPAAWPSSRAELLQNAEHVLRVDPIRRVVWKVDRGSVGWSRGPWRVSRRIKIEGASLLVEVIGGIRDWWFVSAKAQIVIDKLRAQPVRRDA